MLFFQKGSIEIKLTVYSCSSDKEENDFIKDRRMRISSLMLLILRKGTGGKEAKNIYFGVVRYYITQNMYFTEEVIVLSSINETALQSFQLLGFTYFYADLNISIILKTFSFVRFL